jgi:hypothetical protein
MYEMAKDWEVSKKNGLIIAAESLTVIIFKILLFNWFSLISDNWIVPAIIS